MSVVASANSLSPEQQLELARQARLVERVLGRSPTRERVRWHNGGLTITMGEEQEDGELDSPVNTVVDPDGLIRIVPKKDGKTGSSPKVPPGKRANDTDEDEDSEVEEVSPVIPMTVGQAMPYQASANSLSPDIRESIGVRAGFVGAMVERHRTSRGPQRISESCSGQRLQTSSRSPKRGLAESAVDRLNTLNRERPDLSQAERARLAWLSTFPATVKAFAPVGRFVERTAFSR